MESAKTGLNRSWLKYLALIFMVLDNAYFRFNLNSVIHLITRFVAPLYAWLMVEGFFYTKSRKHYCLRLWTAALLMQFGNFLSLLLFSQRGISDNIFLTLAISFSILWLFELAKENPAKKIQFRILGWFLFLVGAELSLMGLPLGDGLYLNLEGGLQLLPLVLIAYFFRHSKIKQAILIILYSLLQFYLLYGGPAMAIFQGFDMFCVNSDWMTWQVIPFIFLYNGEKGKSRPFDKWFFYAFYPLHLWILLLLSQVLQM